MLHVPGFIDNHFDQSFKLAGLRVFSWVLLCNTTCRNTTCRGTNHINETQRKKKTTPKQGRGRSKSTSEDIYMGNNITTPAPLLGRCRTREQNTYFGGKTWVARKTKPINPRVAASLGEPMLLRGTFWEDNRSDGTIWHHPGEIRTYFLGGKIGWTRRGEPFWEDNIIGQMVRSHHPGEIRTYFQG